MATTYHVAWWNLENLFDHRDASRTEKLHRAIGSDLAHWTPELRDRKIEQLSSIIRQLGGGSGPDLLGVCEVENATVLQMLVTRVEALTGDAIASSKPDGPPSGGLASRGSLPRSRAPMPDRLLLPSPPRHQRWTAVAIPGSTRPGSRSCNRTACVRCTGGPRSSRLMVVLVMGPRVRPSLGAVRALCDHKPAVWGWMPGGA